MEYQESFLPPRIHVDNLFSVDCETSDTNVRCETTAHALNNLTRDLNDNCQTKSSKEVYQITDNQQDSTNYRNFGGKTHYESTAERASTFNHNPSYVHDNNNACMVRTENAWFYYGLVRICRQESKIRTNSIPTKTVTPNWFEIRDYITGGTSSQFFPRYGTRSNVSNLSDNDINVCQTTVLALLCRLDMHLNMTNSHNNSFYDKEYKSVILDTFRIAIDKCPLQLYCGESSKGNTPLRVAACNPNILPDVLELLLWSSIQYGIMKVFEPCYFSLAIEPDKCGLTPMDHVLQRIQEEDIQNETEKLALQCLSVIITYTQPMSLLPSKTAPIWPTSTETQQKQLDSSTPIIRLLSLGTSFKNSSRLKVDNTSQTRFEQRLEGSSFQKISKSIPSLFSEPNPCDDDFTTHRLERMLCAVRMLLDWDPMILYQTSITTDCTPLHICVKNYGNFLPLVDALIQRDETVLKSNSFTSISTLVHHRNRFGDLPIHVGSSVGVPIDVLQLLIQKTVESDCFERSEVDLPKKSAELSCFVPHPLLWSYNNVGYTPVDLELIRFFEYGGIPLNRTSLHYTRGPYPLNCRGKMQQRQTSTAKKLKSNRYDETIVGLLSEVVDGLIVIEKTSNLIGEGQKCVSNDTGTIFFDFGNAGLVIDILMERILMIVRNAFPSFVQRTENEKRGATSNTNEYILHLASSLISPFNGPTLPIPLLNFLVWKHPEQLLQPDPFEGKLPLHIALSSHSMHPNFKVRVSSSSSPCFRENYNGKKEWKDWVQTLLRKSPLTSAAVDKIGRLPIHCALDCWGNESTNKSDDMEYILDDVVHNLITNHPHALETADPITELFPFQAAAANSLVSLNMVYTLLRQWPSGVSS